MPTESVHFLPDDFFVLVCILYHRQCVSKSPIAYFHVAMTQFTDNWYLQIFSASCFTVCLFTQQNFEQVSNATRGNISQRFVFPFEFSKRKIPQPNGMSAFRSNAFRILFCRQNIYSSTHIWFVKCQSICDNLPNFVWYRISNVNVLLVKMWAGESFDAAITFMIRDLMCTSCDADY